jgi:hypothetical protein
MVDYVTEGLAKLPSQFQDSPIYKELLTIYLEEFQAIEDCLQDILAQSMNVDLAEGVQLDNIGEHLGRRREGLSDTDYRKALTIQKILNAGEGQYSTALQMWRAVLESPTATLEEEFPAGVALYSDVGAPTLTQLDTFIKALPITVTASIIASFSGADAFCFEGGVGAGFGTTGDSGIGGELVSRYTSII